MKEINIRRSVRQFSTKKVEEEKIIKLLKAAMQAPSAKNQQPWEFIVVEDENKISELSNASKYSVFSKEAPLLIVVLARKDNLKVSEYVPQDLGACIQNLMLEAVNLELGSTWMGIYPGEERVNFLSKALEIDESKATAFALIAVGYPKKEELNKFVDRFDEKRIHREKY